MVITRSECCEESRNPRQEVSGTDNNRDVVIDRLTEFVEYQSQQIQKLHTTKRKGRTNV